MTHSGSGVCIAACLCNSGEGSESPVSILVHAALLQSGYVLRAWPEWRLRYNLAQRCNTPINRLAKLSRSAITAIT
jgi:hypothetical protein